jgi:hypothetical protein
VKFDLSVKNLSKRRSAATGWNDLPDATFLGGGYGTDGKTAHAWLLDYENVLRSVPLYQIYPVKSGETIRRRAKAAVEEYVGLAMNNSNPAREVYDPMRDFKDFGAKVCPFA